VWNAGTLTLERELSYAGEGWGSCYDGAVLWMSDGSATLSRRDPETFELLGSVLVEHEGRPVDELNELECVGTDVFANVWRFQHIVRIDSASGRVTGWIETGDLLEHPDVGEHDRALSSANLGGRSNDTLFQARPSAAVFRAVQGSSARALEVRTARSCPLR
jgi:glutamine cyclotransferase